MNVTKPYRKTKYFHTFNIISVRKSLLFNNENSNNSFTNNISPKPKSNFFTKTPRFQRYSIDDLNDSSVFFDQRRQNFPIIFNFSSLSKADNSNSRQQTSSKPKFFFQFSFVSRRQTSGATSAKKALYYSSLNPSSQSINIDNITVITSKQLQRIINIVIDNYVQRYSLAFELVEFFDFAESSES